MEIDEMNKQDKETIIQYLMRCYRDSRSMIKFMEDCCIVTENIEQYRYEKKTCFLVDNVLREMQPTLRELLQWEFERPMEENPVAEKYSRSTYYRLRTQAIDDFLRCL